MALEHAFLDMNFGKCTFGHAFWDILLSSEMSIILFLVYIYIYIHIYVYIYTRYPVLCDMIYIVYIEKLNKNYCRSW